ncbi:hypothetical protein, partial [Methanobrevibacter sp.]|uniref:hypothetical protein n=1 Tax=Methanobrevibacter sp. TaxID=66852 RepID=UPI003890FAE7
DLVLNNNRMDYWFERDDGAAIFNGGVVICYNCSFTNNYAKNGGAIYNEGVLLLNNCTFSNNKAYGQGKDVCIDEGAQVTVDGKNITCDNDIIHFYKSDLKDRIIVIAAGVALAIAGFVVSFIAMTAAIYLVPAITMTGVIMVGAISLAAFDAVAFGTLYFLYVNSNKDDDNTQTVE